MQLSLLKRRVASVVLSALALAGAVACQSDKSASPAAALSGPGLRHDIVAGDSTSAAICADSAVALPGDSTAVRVTTLTRAVPLAQDITVSGVIGRAGGYIQIPEAGAWLYVPKGVVRDRAGVNFTITAKAGSAVAYEFGPEGSFFGEDYVVIVQDLPQTNWKSLPDPLALEGGYFASDRQLDSKHGKAVVSEFVYTDVDLKHSRALVYVNHFSGYVIATGSGKGAE